MQPRSTVACRWTAWQLLPLLHPMRLPCSTLVHGLQLLLATISLRVLKSRQQQLTRMICRVSDGAWLLQAPSVCLKSETVELLQELRPICTGFSVPGRTRTMWLQLVWYPSACTVPMTNDRSVVQHAHLPLVLVA